jgi:tetratricopeptide (TPR) repeat protein
VLNQTSTRFVFKTLFPALLLALAAPGMYGEVRLYPDQEVSRIAALSEPLPVGELARAAFIASGAEAADIDPLVRRMTALAETAPPSTGNQAADGEALLAWMHEEVLVGYVEEQTRMDVLLDRGTYNCVSSAVLYMILAKSRGIGIHGVLTADHAFCRIPPGEGGEGYDVETTTPYGFDPGRRLDAVDSFTGRTGFRYVPPGNYRQRNDIGEKELVSLIYQNRMAALQKSGRWEDTVGLARDRWELAGSIAAAADFRNSVNNYAAAMDRRRMHEDGLRFLNAAAESLGPGHDLEDTASALLGNAVALYLREGKTADAQALLEDSELTALVPGEFLDDRRRAVAGKSLELLVKSAPFSEAAAAVDRAYSDGLIDDARWAEFSLYLWSTEARSRSAGGRWLDGWQFLSEAPERTQSLPRWNDLAETYRHNAVVDYHNRFASAFRARRFDEARSILEEGVSHFPDAPILKDDMKALSDRL